ncbi:4Fe-4S dicluster domain-containing protein [Acidipila rosea]|uniref:4Fe-4S dicluster domain-containing protein n=1 Tax=Acidipila rosea TaxID=768535 RepID=UPI00104C9EAB
MPYRPGSCQPESGNVVPVIDRNRCDGKQDCVAVCPFEVFEMRLFSPGEIGRPHKRKPRWQAIAVHAERCHGCNLCVIACPESAIRLRSTHP